MSKIKKVVEKLTQQQLDKMYKYHQIIDQGSYGVVCKYEDLQTHQFVAIKILKQDDGVQSFRSQQQIMRKIDHENVLKCLGFYYNITKSQYLLIMPFCQKNNLKKCIGQLSQYDEGFKIQVCLQIAKGLNALHEKNIMHRDIKPANILIDKNWKIKLCDFGFGKIDQGMEKTTKIGTPIYRDPNTLLGVYTKKCDIYSVGLVFDMIFRGKSVFENVPKQKFPQQLSYFTRNNKQIIKKLSCCEQMKKIILDCIVREESKRLNSQNLVQRVSQVLQRFRPTPKPQQRIKQSKINDQSKISNNTKQKLLNNFSLQISQQKKQKNEKKFQDHVKNNKDLNNNNLVNRLGTMNSIYYPIENNQINIMAASELPKIINKYSLLDLKNKKSESQKNKIDLTIKLLKTSIQLSKDQLKNQNFMTVYNYFQNRKKLIRQIKCIQKCESIPHKDKKIILFIVLFGYLRFLKIVKLFMDKNFDKINLKDIKGVTIENLSQAAINNCLQIIKNQTQIAKDMIKPFLLDLWIDKDLYKQKLTKNVLKYLNQGYEKKFIQIQQYCLNQLQQQYENIVTNQRYVTYNQQQIKLKKKILQIAKVF